MRFVLKKYEYSVEGEAQAKTAITELQALLKKWAGHYLITIEPTGSYAKGTRIKGGTDLDLLISLGPRTPFEMPKIYEHLFGWLKKQGFEPVRQNISVGVRYKGLAVDLIPAKQEWGVSNNHYIFETARNRTTRTNFTTHTELVRNSGWANEIKALKIWRTVRELRFPSFCLELVVIDALRNRPKGLLVGNFEKLLAYLRDIFPGAPFRDPANLENIVSDDLLEHEKLAIADAAAESLREKDWARIIW
ncbi:MAG: nucleotidyltransferase [candidate division WOR-3 bacterium]